MRGIFLYFIDHSLQVGLGAGAIGSQLPFGVSIFAASTAAILPAAPIHTRAAAVHNPFGGDFSGIGFLLVPTVFYIIWLPALPLCFLIAIGSPALRRLGHIDSNDKSRNPQAGRAHRRGRRRKAGSSGLSSRGTVA